MAAAADRPRADIPAWDASELHGASEAPREDLVVDILSCEGEGGRADSTGKSAEEEGRTEDATPCEGGEGEGTYQEVRVVPDPELLPRAEEDESGQPRAAREGAASSAHYPRPLLLVRWLLLLPLVPWEGRDGIHQPELELQRAYSAHPQPAHLRVALHHQRRPLVLSLARPLVPRRGWEGVA